MCGFIAIVTKKSACAGSEKSGVEDELALCRVLGQVAQEGARLRNRPADDRAGMGRQVQRLPSGRRMQAHQAMAHRFEARDLLGGEIGEADAAREWSSECSQTRSSISSLVLGRVRRRPRACRRTRCCRPRTARCAPTAASIWPAPPVRTVGVPEPVAQLEEPFAVVAGDDLAVPVEVGQIAMPGPRRLSMPCGCCRAGH